MSLWKTVPFWTVARRVERTGVPDARLLSVYRDWGVVPKDSRDDNFNRASEDLSNYKIVHPGDLVLNKMKTWQGSLGVSDYNGIVSPAYFVCELGPSVNGRYLHHLLRSQAMIAAFRANSKGIRPNQWDLPYEVLHDIPLPMPPLEEQRRIADFLDDRVARIDKIIAARKQQVHALDSYRISQVLRSVVHEGDKFTQCGRLAEIQLGRQRSPETEYGDYMIPYIRSANVTDGHIDLDDVKQMNFSPHEQEVFGLRPGDVLVTEAAGSAESIGASCIWMEPAKPVYGYQNHLLRLRARDGVSAEYLEVWARASHANGAAKAFATGASILNLGTEAMKRMPIPDISIQEQRERAYQAHHVLSAFKTTSDALSREVALLQEYKQSLITAAVNGEFDVTTASKKISE